MEILSYCDIWNGTFNSMFHSANIVLGVGFLMPQTFEQAFLCMRLSISLGLILILLWASETSLVCKAPSLLIWNACFVLINSFHLLLLIKKHLPTFISASHRELYENVFQPLQISKKDFKYLLKAAKIETYSYGKYFCQEQRTLADKNLHILLSGMMTVRCDGFFLQAIQPLEFINSVEWKCAQYGQAVDTHQVTVEAITECSVLVLPAEGLEKAYDAVPDLRFVLDALVGRDIARKLYAVSDIAKMSNHQYQQEPCQQRRGKHILDLRRTISMDAIHTGGKGHVRSGQWIKDANLRQFQADEHVALVNFELDVPPPMEYLPHRVPIQILDKDVMAEAQFLAQQRKYWPSGLL